MRALRSTTHTKPGAETKLQCHHTHHSRNSLTPPKKHSHSAHASLHSRWPLSALVGLRALEAVLWRPQRLYFALQRMINERPRDAHYDDRTLGLNADKHRLQQLLADEGDANLADMEVVRLNSHHSNSKTPRASVKQNSHQVHGAWRTLLNPTMLEGWFCGLSRLLVDDSG